MNFKNLTLSLLVLAGIAVSAHAGGGFSRVRQFGSGCGQGFSSGYSLGFSQPVCGQQFYAQQFVQPQCYVQQQFGYSQPFILQQGHGHYGFRQGFSGLGFGGGSGINLNFGNQRFGRGGGRPIILPRGNFRRR